MCSCVRSDATICGSLRQMRAKIWDRRGLLQRALGDRLSGRTVSVLAQRFADPALGELVLARDALDVDARQHVHAMPGPLGDLGGVDAAFEPYGYSRAPFFCSAVRMLDRLFISGYGC